MPRKYSPTKTIEKSSVTREHVWYKKPRQNVLLASKKRFEKNDRVTTLRSPNKLETFFIHYHPTKKGEMQVTFPSKNDFDSSKRFSVKTSAIAVRVGREVVGYVFLK